MNIKTLLNKGLRYFQKIDKNPISKKNPSQQSENKSQETESKLQQPKNIPQQKNSNILLEKISTPPKQEKLPNAITPKKELTNVDGETTDLLGETDYALYKANLKNTPPAIILLVGKPELIGKQWILGGEIEILGRSSSSSIIVHDSSISKSHLKFQITSDHLVSVIDLQSTNGLIINSHKQPALKPIALKNNDQIKLGNLVFKFLEKGNLETISSSQLYQKSLIDPLTNISNKRAFESNITSRMLLKNTFSLIIFDIDHFKNFNNKHGHLCGDFILTEMSKVISSTLIRDEDFLARYGGEEFCLIVPQKISLATDISERLRKSIDSYNFNFQGKELHVSISLGVTERRISDDMWTDIFDRADKALYKSKAKGRNLVTAD